MRRMARQSQRNLAAGPTADTGLGAALGSGVRGPRRKALSPPSGVHSKQDLLQRPPGYVPPRPTFDSEPQMTQVKAPDIELLAITRGKMPGGQVRRLAWFVLGVLVGACVVWAATSDVKADVYRARLWAASELRSLHGHDDASDATPSASAPAPAPAVGPLTVAPIPTVDIGRLPHSTPHAPATATAPTFAPSSPGDPVLPHAPGPR
jgi:hypothetical protein